MYEEKKKQLGKMPSYLNKKSLKIIIKANFAWTFFFKGHRKIWSNIKDTHYSA